MFLRQCGGGEGRVVRQLVGSSCLVTGNWQLGASPGEDV